jgi:hypothetical protein
MEDEAYPGFYDTAANIAEEAADSTDAIDKYSEDSTKPVALVLDVPNRVKMAAESTTSVSPEHGLRTSCALMQERKFKPGSFRRQKNAGAALYDIFISEFPCQIDIISAA